MRRFFTLIIILLQFAVNAQKVDRQQFFLDDRVIEVTLNTDIKKLLNDKKTVAWQPATVEMRFSDTSSITAEVKVEPRGEFRKKNCDLASLMLDFKDKGSKLAALKKLKLVGGCHSSEADEELLLREFLVYKIYNFISPMSFRVRLLHISYRDVKSKAKQYTQYAFLIEDLKDLCDRNNCQELKKEQVKSFMTDRMHSTLVCMFQYMIGNTDWSLPNFHNIKFIVPKTDTLAAPYIIPYDFDYCGVVNAAYAVPAEQFGTTSVRERVYRGNRPTNPDLQQIITVFKENKEKMMYYINNFPLLRSGAKKDIVAYLDEFYHLIESKNSIRSVFNPS